MAEENYSSSSEESLQDKTEEPTARRQEKAKERGSVAKSMEVNSAFAMIFGLLLMSFVGSKIILIISNFTREIFMSSAVVRVNEDNVQKIFVSAIETLVYTALPIASGLMLIGVMANVAQVGFMFAPKQLEFSFSKLNVIEGIKKVVFSRRALMELGKGVAKVLVVAIVGYYALKEVIEEALVIVDSDMQVVLAFIGNSTLSVGYKMGLAFLALALFDYAFQRKEHMKKLKMTKQEIKEEMKETEGDPLVKSRIRMIQRTFSRRRMLQDVKTADVIITNPTHIAVALKYEIGKMDAPRVVAKGAELLAEKIKVVAKENNVPIIENKTLAQTLFKTVEIGKSIPENLFQAIAQILAYVYKIRKNKFGFALN